MKRKIVKRTDRGAIVFLNGNGETMPLYRDASVNFADFAGSKVTLHCSDRWVTCDAVFPESFGSVRWHFSIEDSEDSAQGRLDGAYCNLETLLSDFRVALNGRL